MTAVMNPQIKAAKDFVTGQVEVYQVGVALILLLMLWVAFGGPLVGAALGTGGTIVMMVLYWATERTIVPSRSRR